MEKKPAIYATVALVIIIIFFVLSYVFPIFLLAVSGIAVLLASAAFLFCVWKILYELMKYLLN